LHHHCVNSVYRQLWLFDSVTAMFSCDNKLRSVMFGGAIYSLLQHRAIHGCVAI